MSLLHSSTAIAYTKSSLTSIQLCKLKTFGQQSRCRSRGSQFCTCLLQACRSGQYFLIYSCVHLPNACESSLWLPLHFQDYRTYFRLPLTSSSFTFAIFLILCTFHLRQWPLASPC